MMYHWVHWCFTGLNVVWGGGYCSLTWLMITSGCYPHSGVHCVSREQNKATVSSIQISKFWYALIQINLTLYIGLRLFQLHLSHTTSPSVCIHRLNPLIWVVWLKCQLVYSMSSAAAALVVQITLLCARCALRCLRTRWIFPNIVGWCLISHDKSLSVLTVAMYSFYAVQVDTPAK